MMAPNPASSARATSSRLRPGSAWAYSWNQRRPAGAAAATSSIEWLAIVDSVNGIPASAAALADAVSAEGCASPWTAIGAIASGIDTASPSIVVAGSTVAASTSTRGTSR